MYAIMSSPKYGRLLRDHARTHNDTLEYSEPQLVNGGMAPPPCRGLPGTVCYMVIVSVNHLDFFGFGPSAALAQHYAEKDAYTSISAMETNGVQLPALVDSDGSLCVSNTDSVNGSVSSALNNGSELINGVEDGYPECMPDAVSTGEAYCAIPYESASEQPISKDICKVPHTVEELNTILETPPPFRQAPDTITCEHRNKNIVDALFDAARKRGIYDINFSFKVIGSKNSKQVVVRAFGGGFSFEGRHFQEYLAKCEAAAKLLETLSQLPELNCGPLPSSHLARPLDLPISQDQNGVEDLFVQKEAAKIVTPNRPLLPVPPSPVTLVTSCASDKQNLLIVSNPIGQLNDLLAKERLTDAKYTFTSCPVGKNSHEFSCIVSARGLSSKGVGLSKKQAKRCAAENLLSEMKSQGMNVDPDKSPTSSMKNKASPGVPLTSQGVPLAGGHRNEQPSRHVSLLQPRDLYFNKPSFQSTPRPPHSAPRPPRDIPLPPALPFGSLPPPLPFGPPPRYLRSPRRRDFPIPPILPPMQAHLRPPLLSHHHPLPPQLSYHHLRPTISPHTHRVPRQRGHQIFSSDSESDSDCGRISSGLKEIIPASCSSNNESSLVPKSEDGTTSYCRPEQIAYKHQRIPMPGVRIGTQHIESHTNTEVINSSRPKEEFRIEQLHTPGSSSDPLQFYTRLPQKRATPWSSVNRPLGGSKDKLVFTRLRQKELRSNNTFTPKWRPQRKAEPWVLPESEMWDVISPSTAEETVQPTAVSKTVVDSSNEQMAEITNCKKVEVNSNPVCENKSHSTKNEHKLDKVPKNITRTACVESVSTGSQEGGGIAHKKVLASPQAPLPVHPLLASYSITKSPNYTSSRSYNSTPVTSTTKDSNNNLIGLSSPPRSSPTSIKSRNEARNKRQTDKSPCLDMFSIVGSLSVTTDSSVMLPSEGSIENMAVSLY